MWLNGGEPVRWSNVLAPAGDAVLDDAGETLLTEFRIDRRSLINGLFYGIDGMRIGGTRHLEIAPHLGYGTEMYLQPFRPMQVLTAEITTVAVASVILAGSPIG
jgi:FKBP-type peptidyl-prolyl cis-trans isomerase 2